MAKKDSNGNPLRKSRGLKRKRDGVADWAIADKELLVKAICQAANQGGALRFGYSRDGGAYALGIYGDGDPYTEFIPPEDDLDAVLSDVIDLFEEIADSRSAGAKAPKTA